MRELVCGMRSDWTVSIRSARGAIGFDRSMFYYKSRRTDQAALEKQIKEICETRVRYGYRRVHVLLDSEGWGVNIKKVFRIYSELSLPLRNKTPRRRVRARLRDDRAEAVGPTDVSLSRMSTCAAGQRGDQASAFLSRDMDLWTYQRGVTSAFSWPGKATDNAFIQAFNGRFWAECLNTHWFLTLGDAVERLQAWPRYDNAERPHGAIGNKAPIMMTKSRGITSLSPIGADRTSRLPFLRSPAS